MRLLTTFMTHVDHKERQSHVLPVLLLITTTLTVFLPAMFGGFLWDDKILISENPVLQGNRFLEQILTSPFGGNLGLDENSIVLDRFNQFYRPATSLSYWLDFQIWGLNPASFHLTNIIIHMMNVLLLYAILLRVGLRILTSFFGAALFALYPLHFENVAWISGRTDLLSFLFAAVSVLFFLKYLSDRRFGFLIASGGIFLLSLLAKENTLFLPGLYFLALWSKEPRFRAAILKWSPFAAAGVIWFCLRANALGGAGISSSGRSLLDGLAVLGFYLFRLIFPFRLSYSVDAGPIFSNAVWIVLGFVAVFGVMASVLLILRRIKNLPLLPFFYLALIVFLWPAVMVIFSGVTESFVAWRFLYLASAVMTGGAAYLALSRIKFRSVAVSALILVGILFTSEIYPKNRNFGREQNEFWLNIPNIEKEDFLVRYNVGVETLRRNESAGLRIFNSILSEENHFLHDNYESRIWEHLAEYYTMRKEPEKARPYFELLMRKHELQSQHFYVTYASFLALEGKVEAGEEIIQRMLNLFPKNHLILRAAARFYLLIEDYPRAIALLERDLSLFPTEESRVMLEVIRKEASRSGRSGRQ